jgi:hypothetical protein
MEYTLEELREMMSVFDNKTKEWHIAKPIGSKKMKLKNRIKAAFLVLFNKAVVVRWV